MNIIEIHRILRKIKTCISTIYNYMYFSFSGCSCGSGLVTCGSVFIRNYNKSEKIIFGNHLCINSHMVADPIGGDTKTIICAGSSGKIRIGNNVGISNSAIFSQNEIIIDDGACIGGSCKIYDSDFHSIYTYKRNNGNQDVKTAPVHICKNVFIGAHCVILKGVTIGTGSVIGAGSIVTHNIPDHELWAGNPVKFIKKIDE